MTDIWEKVKEFHDKFAIYVPHVGNTVLVDLLEDDSQELRKTASDLRVLRKKFMNRVGVRYLRIALLVEELSEYLEAEADNDLVEIADALSDIHYIAAGTELSYGINGRAVFDEVHASNMSKLGEDGKPIYNEAGKILKPDRWSPPRVELAMHLSEEDADKQSGLEEDALRLAELTDNFMDDVMPQMSKIVLQDYGALNELCLLAGKLKNALAKGVEA